MHESLYNSMTAIKNGYKYQLIYYYNKGIGYKSEIANVLITPKLIAAVEKRYEQLGGFLPISKTEIFQRRGQKW